jgi:hypothetical protein
MIRLIKSIGRARIDLRPAALEPPHPRLYPSCLCYVAASRRSHRQNLGPTHCWQVNARSPGDVRLRGKLSHANEPRHGRAIAQAVSSRLPTAADRVRARVRLCGICGGQSSTGAGFSPSTSVAPANSHSTDCSTIIMICHPGLVQ